MSVLRRLYNVAYGQVRIWREGSSEPDAPLDPEPLPFRPPPGPRPSERATEPLDEESLPFEPTEPRPRRL